MVYHMATIILQTYPARRQCARCRKLGHLSKTCLRRNIYMSVVRGLRRAGIPVRRRSR